MKISVRKAVEEDCVQMMELVHELAVYERAQDEVTVDFKHFVFYCMSVMYTLQLFVLIKLYE